MLGRGLLARPGRSTGGTPTVFWRIHANDRIYPGRPGREISLRQPPGVPPITPWGARNPAAAGAHLGVVRFKNGGLGVVTRTSSGC